MKFTLRIQINKTTGEIWFKSGGPKSYLFDQQIFGDLLMEADLGAPETPEGASDLDTQLYWFLRGDHLKSKHDPPALALKSNVLPPLVIEVVEVGPQIVALHPLDRVLRHIEIALEKALVILSRLYGENDARSQIVAENLTLLGFLWGDESGEPWEPDPGSPCFEPPADKASQSFSISVGSKGGGGKLGPEYLLQAEVLLSKDPTLLSASDKAKQEMIETWLPEFEKQIWEENCPDTDAHFPWELNEEEPPPGGEASEDVEEIPLDDIDGIGASKDDEVEKDEQVVTVHFATNRNLKKSKNPEKRFGSKRSELRYGICRVNIPPDHKRGELERPSFLRLEFRPKPEDHMMILECQLQSGDAFFAGVNTRMGQADVHTAFIFIHGYNVNFTQAALRTAQMARDLNYQGVPVFFSWPSKGTFIGYTHDEANVEWATRPLKDFLKDFIQRTSADKVVLIAHSMGNRALTRAYVALLKDYPELASKFQDIILAAPDIDADVFKRDIAPAMVDLKQPVTLYTGATDFALKCSKLFHGYPRAGHSEDGIVIVKGMETVDATNSATGFLRHSYVSNSRDVITDIGYMIRHGHRADDRISLKPVESDEGKYWKFES